MSYTKSITKNFKGILNDDLRNIILDKLDIPPHDFTDVKTHLYWHYKFLNNRFMFHKFYDFIIYHIEETFNLKKVRDFKSITHMNYFKQLNVIINCEIVGDYYDERYKRVIGDASFNQVWDLEQNPDYESPLPTFRKMEQMMNLKIMLGRIEDKMKVKENNILTLRGETVKEILNEIIMSFKNLLEEFIFYFKNYKKVNCNYGGSLKTKIIKDIKNDLDKINFYLNKYN